MQVHLHSSPCTPTLHSFNTINIRHLASASRMLKLIKRRSFGENHAAGLIVSRTQMRKSTLRTTQTQMMESDSSDESGEETEETAGASDHEWKSKNGQIVWSFTHVEMLHYMPANRVIPGPKRHGTAPPISALWSLHDRTNHPASSGYDKPAGETFRHRL